ncbi:MAG: RnfABCDGE type electron transport complex subunit G [Bacteroidota bacterium]|nr:RnfABCDGE type electron transport complex subunit G [Bacteroidota bacterium]
MSNKKKPDSNFVNMVVALFLVTSIAGVALGSVYIATKEPIAKAKREKLEKAIGTVLPAFDVVETVKVMPLDGPDSLTFYRGYKDDQFVGTAVKTYTNKGFSGHFDIMVGFGSDNTILNTAVLKHSETPGLGDKMDVSKSDFSVQFNGKNPADYNLKVTKDGGDVDAITAATISSRAFCDAVQRAYDTYKSEGGRE